MSSPMCSSRAGWAKGGGGGMAAAMGAESHRSNGGGRCHSARAGGALVDERCAQGGFDA
jgi:hypothetical protein